MHKRSAVSVIALTLVLVSSAAAQVTARLSGSVVDQTGSAVPAATVDVFLPGGAKPILTSNTTQDGLFAFAGIPAGTYDVVITANGFRKHSERGVVLSAATEDGYSRHQTRDRQRHRRGRGQGGVTWPYRPPTPRSP